MEADSDSDGSHISATPPREEPKPSQSSAYLSLASSYKPKSKPKTIRVPTRSKPKLTAKTKSTPKLKTKTQTQTQSQSHEEIPRLSTSFSLPDFENLPSLPIPIPIRGVSDRNEEVSSVQILPSSFSRKFSSFSSNGRSFPDPESVEKDSAFSSVSISQPESSKSDQTEVKGNCSDLDIPEISVKPVHGRDSIKPSKRHPNSISGGDSQPLPVKRPKPTSEGNFVRLNINGYGRSKFLNRRGQRGSSYSSRNGRSRWRSNRKSKAESKGVCEEDVLVSETLKHQEERKKSDSIYKMVQEVASGARDDPSDENLMKLLKLSHGYDSFREGQLEAIKNVIAGKSTMLVLPTGAGKSLCYQLPAMILPGLTLVVSPLVALMVDQLRQLPPMIQGGLLASNQESEEASNTIRLLLEGNIKVLYVSPERFLNAEFLSLFGPNLPVSLVVIDEAHCLSEWSHNFRPSYLRLRASLLQAKLNVNCILAMTATATTKTLQAVMCSLDIPTTNLIQTSQIRENFQLSVTLSGNRMKDLMMLMKSSPFMEIKSTIIYCKFQSETDLLSKYLRDNNISAKSYHGGIPSKDRSRTQELFCSNKIRVVVATVAFGMGLNKSDVGAVIHYSLPDSLEEYVQEIGRAGRDGRLSYCHLFFDDTIYFKLRSLSYSDGVDEYAVNKFLSHVFSNSPSAPGKISSLAKESASQKFDMKEEVLLTVLTYLEIGEVQYLRLLPQLNVTCTLYFHKTSPVLLAGNDSAVAAILKKHEMKQGAYVFDIPTIANGIGATPIDLSNHLQKLKLKGEITYELKDLAFCYTVLKTPGDFCSLAAHLTRWLSDVEICKVKKLDAMFNAVTYAAKICEKVDGCSGTQHTNCLQRRIKDYFSSEDDDSQCHFSNKMGQSSPFLRADIKVFLQSNSHAKFTPRAVARIMHGIPSPAYPTATWSKTHFWGRYSQIDFPVVMEAATMELMNFAGKHL